MGLESITSVGTWVLERAKSKLSKQGIGGTAKWVFSQAVEIPQRCFHRRRALRRERAYDRLHGIDTAGIVSPAQLVMDSRLPVNGYAYQGCDPDIIIAAIRRLPIRYEDFTYIDLGSGKGRSLHCTREFNFKRYIGVEFSPNLCEIARHNNASLKARDPAYPDWEIVCADAGAYEFSGPAVLCMFNPFGPEVMQRVIARASTKSELYVLYFDPTLAPMWERDGAFQTLYAQADYRVYALAQGTGVST